MAKIFVDQPFNFREGPKTTHYAASKEAQDVSDACAAHAVNVAKVAHFPPEPKAKPAAATPAE